MYHFINCMLLAFAPLVIVYKATQLSEESGFRACLFAGLGYGATQIVKIFVMASVLPSSGDDLTALSHGSVPNPHDFSLLEEVAKTLITLLVEVVGVQLILQVTPNLSKFSAGTRVLAVGLGLAAAESLLTYALPIFWLARAAEFTWQPLEMALASNLSLLLHVAFVAAVWLRTRTDLSAALAPMVWAVLAASAVLPSLERYLGQVQGVDSWNLMGFRALLALALCIVAKVTMRAYTAQRAAGASGKKAQ